MDSDNRETGSAAPKARPAKEAELLGAPRSSRAGPLPLIGATLNVMLCPTLTVVSLAICTVARGESFSGYYLLLGILAFLISSRIFDDIDLFLPWRPIQLMQATRRILLGWAAIVGSVVFLGFATQLSVHYDYGVIAIWFVATPVALLLGVKIARTSVRRLMATQPAKRAAVIVGANPLSERVAEKLAEDHFLGQYLAGVFDDRDAHRVGQLRHGQLRGVLSDVARFVRRNEIQYVYIALPMVAQPRIVDLIRQLRDTSASVYFLPDLFLLDVAHATFDDVSGIPVVAIRETPIGGADQVLKRAMDLVFASAFLLFAGPLMLAIAAGVKLSSPGPVLFRQRRYGIDGREIVIRKFRSMRVQEDGERVEQAKRQDPRVTPFGALLRKTSLDELPQFIDVLEGKMSIVGPRPHAVAHNELYRRLIPGYMMRYKVLPGITGWAQVNGCRGETQTLDKMQKRVEFDLDYIKNWSLSLDLWIMLKTLPAMWKRENAY